MHKSVSLPKKWQKDVFHAFLVKNADYDGAEEIPRIQTTENIPNDLIAFSTITKAKNYDGFVHFYEHDCRIEKIWNNPNRYLPIIQRFQGIISPDFSLYYDMSYCYQLWNTYRGKAIANYMQENGVEVIPNVRWGDERSFDLACLGVEKGKTIAVGTHGCIKTIEGKKLFIQGFDYVMKKLKPKTVIVYGRMPDKIFCLAKLYNINLIRYASNYELTHKREVV